MLIMSETVSRIRRRRTAAEMRVDAPTLPGLPPVDHVPGNAKYMVREALEIISFRLALLLSHSISLVTLSHLLSLTHSHTPSLSLTSCL